jgi:two-component system, cell cycle response regulator DivK
MTEKAIHTEERTILIVEDDETSSVLLQVFLSHGNYKFLYAVNGKMAVQMFRENPDIDLILMDLKMPVMDGYIATRQIREMNTNIPILAQSAYALAGDSKKALDAGCDDYITKPVKKEELLAKIKALLK